MNQYAKTIARPLLGLLVICLVFFLLRLPSLYEPLWYGDEGIYEVIGSGLSQGRSLYTEITDNKPPLLYITYALFRGDQFAARLLSLFFGLGAIATFFLLAALLFKKNIPVFLTTICFSLLFATPLIEGNIANAENFMLLFVLLGGLIIYRISTNFETPKKNLFMLAGLLVGIAFLYKIFALFDFLAFLAFLNIVLLYQSFSRSPSAILRAVKKCVLSIFPFIIGFLLPVVFTTLYFVFKGNLVEFLEQAFFSNINYVGYANTFIIPQGFLILKTLLLVILLTFLFIKRHVFTKTELFIIIWLACSMYTAFFSQRNYTHYALATIPSLSLSLGLLFQKNKMRGGYFFIPVFSCFYLLVSFFHLYNIPKVVRYYDNFISYVAGSRDTTTYQSFFDSHVPRDYKIASYISSHLPKNGNVFIWGNSAQIYVLSRTLPPGRFTVAYHIQDNPKRLMETQAALEMNPPEILVVLTNASSYPYELTMYNKTLELPEATLYERDTK